MKMTISKFDIELTQEEILLLRVALKEKADKENSIEINGGVTYERLYDELDTRKYRS